MIGADGEMQRIAGAQAQRILVGESCRRAELLTRHREGGKAANRKAGEHRQHIGAMGGLDLPGAQLDGQHRRELGGYPLADCQIVRSLLAEPGLHPGGSWAKPCGRRSIRPV